MVRKKSGKRQSEIISRNLNKTDQLKSTKKSQLTIFIILGIAIVIILILLFLGRENLTAIFLGKTPIRQAILCLEESSNEGLSLVLSQGGSINPQNYYLYQGNKLDYTCYTEESFQKCVNQKPLLKQSVEKELENYIKPKLDSCLKNLRLSLERRGSTISYKEPELNIQLVPEDILIDVKLDLSISKGDSSETHKKIKTDISSNLYDFVILASLLTNDEVDYGDSDTTAYMFKDKTIKIEKLKQGEESTVYILTDRESDEKFYFAVRSIPIPPGWIGVDNFT